MMLTVFKRNLSLLSLSGWITSWTTTTTMNSTASPRITTITGIHLIEQTISGNLVDFSASSGSLWTFYSAPHPSCHSAPSALTDISPSHGPSPTRGDAVPNGWPCPWFRASGSPPPSSLLPQSSAGKYKQLSHSSQFSSHFSKSRLDNMLLLCSKVTCSRILPTPGFGQHPHVPIDFHD